MKGFIILISLMFVSVTALAQNESRAAIRFDIGVGEEGACEVNLHHPGGPTMLYGDRKIRAQYAGGSLEGGHSNAMMQCRGRHYLDLDETIVLDNGFCYLTPEIGTDHISGAVTPGGNWVFTCSFPRYKEPSE
jgi:hypothetical protein